MDRLSSLEYSLMSDIYDDLANESYDDYNDNYDRYASRYDDYVYDEAFEGSKEPKPGSFGQYMKASTKGKIRAFFRFILNKIATFFKKLGLNIKMLFTKKENKPIVREKIDRLKSDNLLSDASGRLGDICRRAKKPAIKVVESLRKLFTGKAGTAEKINTYQTCVDHIMNAIDEIRQCRADLEKLFDYISDRAEKIGVRPWERICIDILTNNSPKELQELSDCLTKVGIELSRFKPDEIINAANDRVDVKTHEEVTATIHNKKDNYDFEYTVRAIANALNEYYTEFRDFAVLLGIRRSED